MSREPGPVRLLDPPGPGKLRRGVGGVSQSDDTCCSSYSQSACARGCDRSRAGGAGRTLTSPLTTVDWPPGLGLASALHLPGAPWCDQACGTVSVPCSQTEMWTAERGHPESSASHTG